MISVLFLTDRGLLHQQDVLAAAPPELNVHLLRRPAREQALRCLPEVEFLISERSGEIDGAMIAAGKRLRLIQRLGSLTYDIDLDAARAAGIPVAAWPIPMCMRVAEHMLLQMLALAKRLPEVTAVANAAGHWGRPSQRTDEDTFTWNWSRRRDVGELFGRTVGILGFGEIGAELARRLRGFAPARVLYHKRQRLPTAAEAELGVTYAGPDELLAQSDHVCCLLPYSAQTDMLIDAGFLSRLKAGTCLVGCGSGSVVDEAALAQALRAGHLAGAALDTFEWEPIRPDNPLLSLARDPTANVLLTPHTAAGGDSDAGDVGRQEDYENVARLLRGEPILHRVA